MFGHFTLICPFSSLSPSLWETARYRLKYCLKGPLNPKQPTNQPMYQDNSLVRKSVSYFSVAKVNNSVKSSRKSSLLSQLMIRNVSESATARTYQSTLRLSTSDFKTRSTQRSIEKSNPTKKTTDVFVGKKN